MACGVRPCGPFGVRACSSPPLPGSGCFGRSAWVAHGNGQERFGRRRPFMNSVSASSAVAAVRMASAVSTASRRLLLSTWRAGWPSRPTRRCFCLGGLISRLQRGAERVGGGRDPALVGGGGVPEGAPLLRHRLGALPRGDELSCRDGHSRRRPGRHRPRRRPRRGGRRPWSRRPWSAPARTPACPRPPAFPCPAPAFLAFGGSRPLACGGLIFRGGWGRSGSPLAGGIGRGCPYLARRPGTVAGRT